jgi:hypothetical protein
MRKACLATLRQGSAKIGLLLFPGSRFMYPDKSIKERLLHALISRAGYCAFARHLAPGCWAIRWRTWAC